MNIHHQSDRAHVSTLSRWESGKTLLPARAKAALDLLKASKAAKAGEASQ